MLGMFIKFWQESYCGQRTVEGHYLQQFWVAIDTRILMEDRWIHFPDSGMYFILQKTFWIREPLEAPFGLIQGRRIHERGVCNLE